MRMTLFTPLALAALLVPVTATALDGRTITATVTNPQIMHAHASLPYDGEVPEGRVQVVHEDSGTVFPATVGGGMLTFVARDIPGPGTYELTVRVLPEAGTPNVVVEVDEEAGEAEVHIRGEHFTTLHFGDHARIPYLWPVHAHGGVTVTRNWPMGTDEPESRDHPHHMSMWTSFGDVNGTDHWHRAPIRTDRVEAGSGDAFGWIRAYNSWLDRDGDVIVEEVREYVFLDAPSTARTIDQTTTFIASNGDVTFGDDKEGFFGFRIRPSIQGNRAGLLTNSEGKQGESEVYGTPAPWMDYSGEIEGVGYRGIALMSHPSNFRLPAWHVRNYGLVGCNFFAMKNVAGMDEEGTHTLPAGESMTLRARYLVHSGNVRQAGIATRFLEYSQPPAVAWADGK